MPRHLKKDQLSVTGTVEWTEARAQSWAIVKYLVQLSIAGVVGVGATHASVGVLYKVLFLSMPGSTTSAAVFNVSEHSPQHAKGTPELVTLPRPSTLQLLDSTNRGAIFINDSLMKEYPA